MGVFLILIALAGAMGTLARFGMQTLATWLWGEAFPWGTFLVNVIGCFLFGVVWTLAEERQWISKDIRVIILTGFMGAFTTFSTFAFDTGQQLRESHWVLAFANVSGQVVLGLIGLFLGMVVGRLF